MEELLAICMTAALISAITVGGPLMKRKYLGKK